MSLGPAESAALPLLAEVFPDYASVVGPRCAALLKQGQKLEVEALVSAASRPQLCRALLNLSMA